MIDPASALPLMMLHGIPLTVDEDAGPDQLEVDRGGYGQVIGLRARQDVVDRLVDTLRRPMPTTLNPQPEVETLDLETDPQPRPDLEVELDTSDLEAALDGTQRRAGRRIAELWEERWLEAHQLLAPGARVSVHDLSSPGIVLARDRSGPPSGGPPSRSGPEL